MQLDWLTVIAQMVNFLVLVALLKRFLYGPIIRVMEQRQEHIAGRLQEAQERLTAAEQQAALYQANLEELQRTRDSILVKAREEAELQRQSLLEQARQEVGQLQERWHDALRQEQETFLRELRQHAGTQVCAVARRALMDLAGADLEGGMLDAFIERLQELDAEARLKLAEAVQTATPGVVIRSAFALPSDRRQQMLVAVQNGIAASAEVHFAIDPELICGLELEVPGSKLAWNLTQYLDNLEEYFAGIMAQEIAATGAKIA
jgi:F-type H+-transporting ATPase subunit b